MKEEFFVTAILLVQSDTDGNYLVNLKYNIGSEKGSLVSCGGPYLPYGDTSLMFGTSFASGLEVWCNKPGRYL